jgi:hypothetical protein
MIPDFSSIENTGGTFELVIRKDDVRLIRHYPTFNESIEALIRWTNGQPI